MNCAAPREAKPLNAQEFEGLYINLTDETFLEKLSDTLGKEGCIW